MNVHPYVSVLVTGRFAGMQAHPDPDGDAIGPVVTAQCSLRRHAAADGVKSRGKHDEEAVALGPHFSTAGCAEIGGKCARSTLPLAIIGK